jgi:hypothetical protein
MSVLHATRRSSRQAGRSIIFTAAFRIVSYATRIPTQSSTGTTQSDTPHPGHRTGACCWAKTRQNVARSSPPPARQTYRTRARCMRGTSAGRRAQRPCRSGRCCDRASALRAAEPQLPSREIRCRRAGGRACPTLSTLLFLGLLFQGSQGPKQLLVRLSFGSRGPVVNLALSSSFFTHEKITFRAKVQRWQNLETIVSRQFDHEARKKRRPQARRQPRTRRWSVARASSHGTM